MAKTVNIPKTGISKKSKPLLPTLKEKKRYMAFQIISNKEFNGGAVISAIEENLVSNLGTFELAKAGYQFVKQKYNANKGLIRVNNNYVQKTAASLALLDNINNNKAIIDVFNTSGIIKKAMR